MNITFKSKRNGKRNLTTEDLALMHDFMEWTLNKFIKKRSIRFMKIEVVLDSMLLKEFKTYGSMVCVDDKPKNGNHYSIEIDTSNGFANILHTLAHELVHVKQTKLGEWYDSPKNSDIIFNKKLYKENSINYWEQPWEIEAFGRSTGLLRMWIDERKLTKEKWAKSGIKI